MLHRLTIRNFAIIDRLDVEWGDGFNVITGETGAGKSIIIDAVGALLGDRVGPETVRTGADRAVVEGVFTVPDALPAGLGDILDEYGLEVEDGALIVTREVAGPGGRGGARVNGRTVPLAVLQQMGEQLVDVHGQSQHMALLRVREHMEYLDRFGGLLERRDEVARLARALRAVREEIASLRAQERQATREREMLRYQVEEIERAELRVGEEAEIAALRNRLRHVERLRLLVATAFEALHGAESGEAERPGATDLLGEAVASATEASGIDQGLGGTVETLTAVLANAEDAARSLRDYLDSVEADPEGLEQAEERVQLILDLKRKYGATVGEVLGYLEEARAKLAAIETREERLADLESRAEHLRTELGAAATHLSAERTAAGERLSRAVERELADLAMPGTRFRLNVLQEDEPHGVPFGERTVQFDLSGVDRVEFLVAANAGEEPRPMARVASGGELARLALALKTILSRQDERATLIFDEVDVGVGGRTAPVVGEKLWSLATAGHQVLCVTHMAQVAAFGDSHWVVAKRTEGERTLIAIEALDQPHRVDELAAMLAGTVTDRARGSARELLGRARDAKRAGVAP